MKIKIYDGGTFQEVETATSVSTFAELKTVLAENSLFIDYDTKSVVVKPGNTTLELDDAVLPATEELIVFLFPKRTKSGSHFLNAFVREVITATLDAIEAKFDFHLDNDEVEMLEATVFGTVFSDDDKNSNVENVIASNPDAIKLMDEYNRIGRAL